MQANNVTIHNLTLREFRVGLKADNPVGKLSGLELERIVGLNFGDATTSAPTVADGRGIFVNDALGGDNVLVPDMLWCAIKNSSGYGFWLELADDFALKDCYVYCDDITNNQTYAATDYYFIVQQSSGNTLLECEAHRVADFTDPLNPVFPDHAGHGFLIVADQSETHAVSTQNTVDDCKAFDLGEPYRLLGSKVSDNDINDCETTIIAAAGFGGVLFSDGAHDNDVDNLTVTNCNTAVTYWHEGRDEDGLVASEKNHVRNSQFINVRNGVRFSWGTRIDSAKKPLPGWPAGHTNFREAKGNTIVNCSFSGRTIKTLYES